MALVDRPHPIDYEYRGVKAKIDFQWHSDDDDVPAGLTISVADDTSPVIASREKAIYCSVGEAIDRGKQLAENEIDRILGPE